MVRQGGTGSYGVANIAALAAPNRYAGWSLAVVYQDSTQPQRNMVVYDGFLFDQPSFTNLAIPLTGFLTPPFLPVNTAVGLMVYDGDRGGNSQDKLLLNGTPITNTLNPDGNVFNSTISRFGNYVLDRNHNYSNTFGIDIDLFNANNILPTSSTSATLVISAEQKALPGLVTFATEIFRPTMASNLAVNDLNGGPVNPDDILEYTVSLTNTGDLPANQTIIENVIPQFTTYLSGSLRILNSPVPAQIGVQTDFAGDDFADFGANKLTFRFGTGATPTIGGSVGVSETAQVQFRVKVNATAANGDVVSNLTVAKFVANTSGGTFPLSDSSQAIVNVIHPDVTVALAVSPTIVNPGSPLTYTIRVSNMGLQTGTNTSFNLALPAQINFDAVVATSGAPVWTCNYSIPNLMCTAPSLATGAVSMITVSARLDPAFASGQLQSTATMSISPEWVTTNNQAQNVLTVRPQFVYMPIVRR